MSVPIDFLQRSLIYDEMEFLFRDLRDLGIHDNSDGENPTKVVFCRTKFDSSKSIVSTCGGGNGIQNAFNLSSLLFLVEHLAAVRGGKVARLPPAGFDFIENRVKIRICDRK